VSFRTPCVMTPICLCLKADGRSPMNGRGLGFGRSKPCQFGTPPRRTGWYARIVPNQKPRPAWIFRLARGLHVDRGTADFPADWRLDMRRKFWMVYVDGTSSPTHKHDTEHSAAVECVRLAEQPGNKNVFLLSATHAYSLEHRPIRCEVLT